MPDNNIVNIFYCFIILKLNGSEISDHLGAKFKRKASYSTICSILHNILCCIADYIKQKYREKQIGDDSMLNRTVAIDESLYLFGNQGNQIWKVGALDTKKKALRMDIIS